MNNNHSSPKEEKPNVNSSPSSITVPTTNSVIPNLGEQNHEQNNYDTETILGIKEPDTRPASHRDQTASKLASIIVNTFAWSIKLSFLISILHFGIVYSTFAFSDTNSEKGIPRINESMEIFKTVSAVMSGPIGFVFGFYFRENNR